MELQSIDAHVAGAAVRLVVAGLPPSGGGTLAERAHSLMSSSGHALLSLSREPRGHAGTVVVVLAPPDRDDADAGLVFIGSDGLLTLDGEALIGAMALATARGLVMPRRAGRLEIDTLAGAVTAWTRSHTAGDAVAFVAPPATVLRANQPIAYGNRAVHVDLVWTGWEVAAIVDAEAAGAPLVAARGLELQRAGRDLIAALDAGVRVATPDRAAADVACAIFIGAPPEHAADIASGTVHRDGRVSRSPGAGATVAVTTVLSAMGVVAPGQRVVHQGLGGTTLAAEITAIEDREGRAMLTVEVVGDAWPTGDHVFRVAAGDPIAEGLVL